MQISHKCMAQCSGNFEEDKNQSSGGDQGLLLEGGGLIWGFEAWVEFV